jgi:hypothetical protein
MSKLNTTSSVPRAQVRIRVIGERVWVGDCAHGIVLVRTDASEDAEVITDGFRAN